MMRKKLQKEEEGSATPRFDDEDDQEITAESERELQILANILNEGKHFEMKMNIETTKTMVISRTMETPKVTSF